MALLANTVPLAQQQAWPDLTSVCPWQCDRFPDRGIARRLRRLPETEAKRKRSECLESAESRSRDTPGIPAGWAASDTGSRAERSPARNSTKPNCYSTRQALHTRIPRSSTDSYARRLRFPQSIPVGGVLQSAAWRLAAETQKNSSHASWPTRYVKAPPESRNSVRSKRSRSSPVPTRPLPLAIGVRMETTVDGGVACRACLVSHKLRARRRRTQSQATMPMEKSTG